MDTIDSKGLSTSQMENAVTKILKSREFTTRDFLGVYAIDNVNDLIDDCKKCIDEKKCLFWLIYNNRPSHDRGEHWRLLVFYRHNNKWYIYISMIHSVVNHC